MNWKKGLTFFSIASLLFFADALLKAYVHYKIPLIQASSPVYPFGGIPVFHNWYGIDFSIVHVMNKGAAWGMFASLQKYLLYVRIFIIGALLSYLFFVKAGAYRKFCFSLIAVGALGNVVDYFVYGHVVDMFYFILGRYSYPVFNIADSVIFIGVVLLVAEAAATKIKNVSNSNQLS